MQTVGGEVAAAPQENGKRMRRPSVRLHQPYYENPGQRKVQQKWKPMKGVTTPRKPRTAKPPHSRITKNDDANNGRIKGEERMLDFDGEDDVAIGSWTNFSAANMDRDFQRKRVRSSNSKSRVPAKSQRIGNQEIGNSALSTGGESGEQEQDQNGVEEEEDVDLGINGINSNLVVEDSDPSSPCPSFDDDDDGNQLSEDHHNAGGNQVGNQRGLMNNRHSNRMGRELMAQERDEGSSGVRMWLNDLGLRKYAPLFDIHGVDDEVLPLLTLEDLKDMGINEVGVRRKLYSSIQKLERLFP